MQKNFKVLVFSILLTVPVLVTQAAQAKYIYTHLTTCEEAISDIATVGYADVTSVGNHVVYRFFNADIVDSEYGYLCDQARGEWKTFDLLDANEQLCKTPGVVCIDKKSKHKPGKGWESCNGVYHSGSRKDHPYCPPKKKN